MDTAKNKQVTVIGAGIGGLAIAALLGKKGYSVDVYEKLAEPGGRAREFSAAGFRFDMGPSWYMMPDVFEDFFSLLGEDIHDHLKLQKLTPSYRIFLQSNGEHYDFFADREKNYDLFESLEPGAGQKLVEYLDESARQYDIAKAEFIYRNYDSFLDFFNRRTLKEGRKLQIYRSMQSIIESTFDSEIIRKAMMFQMVLLGTAPGDAPGMYRLMNHVDFDRGIWYPEGGIAALPRTIEAIAKKHGVRFHYNQPVTEILTDGGRTTGVRLKDGALIQSDIIVSDADLAYTETNLLPQEKDRTYPASYWSKKVMAPSAFILYLGLDRQYESLQHHNLLFTKDWDKNFKEIFKGDHFPTDPSIYVCAPSKTDSTVAPAGCENLFVLVPIAADLSYDADALRQWREQTISQLETHMRLPGLRESIVYEKQYCVEDFTQDYNSYKGSALGLAHTLTQSALWRPNNQSKKLPNLYYVGANTNPGIGMPTCVISAQTAFKRIEGITDPSPLKEL
jgi:phytoene desaturase